jgi:hypothetical protein
MSAHDESSPTPSNQNSEGSPPAPLSPVLIRIIFLLLGVGVLIPWNAFVSAKPYFQARLCRDGDVMIDFELWFGLVWNTSSVCSLGLIIASVAIKDYFTRFTTTEGETSLILPNDAGTNENRSTGSGSASLRSGSSHQEGHSFWLVMVPLGIYLLVFAITDFLVLVPSLDPRTFLILTLAGLAICGTCGAIATAGIVSTAGLFDSHLGIGPFFSGQALGGVAVSTANFFASALEDPEDLWEQTCAANHTTMTATALRDYQLYKDIRTDFHERALGKDLTDAPPTCLPYSQLDWVVFGYFFAGCVVLACCLVGYTIIDRYQQQEYRDEYEAVQDTQLLERPQEVPHDESPRVGLEMKDQRNVGETNDETLPSSIGCSTRSYHDDADDIVLEQTSPSVVAGGDGESPFVDEISVQPEEYTEEENEIAVFSAVKGPMTCTFLVFSSTLCLFPGWISQLRSAHQCETHFRLANDLYIPLSFVVFNIGDLTGRLLSEKINVTHIPHFSSKLVLSALGRLIIFPPLFLLCVSQNPTSWAISSDLYSLAVQFSFAITNGLLVSCSFMHAPHLVAHSTGMQERASELMTFAVFFGLLTGSLLSFPFSTFASNL